MFLPHWSGDYPRRPIGQGIEAQRLIAAGGCMGYLALGAVSLIAASACIGIAPVLVVVAAGAAVVAVAG